MSTPHVRYTALLLPPAAAGLLTTHYSLESLGGQHDARYHYPTRTPFMLYSGEFVDALLPATVTPTPTRQTRCVPPFDDYIRQKTPYGNTQGELLPRGACTERERGIRLGEKNIVPEIGRVNIFCIILVVRKQLFIGSWGRVRTAFSFESRCLLAGFGTDPGRVLFSF
jgi:hypothetical protein